MLSGTIVKNSIGLKNKSDLLSVEGPNFGLQKILKKRFKYSSLTN